MNQLAKQVIQQAIDKGMIIATAESCTGGLIAAALTDVVGSSAAFDRGFVTYSNEAKAEMLGVPIEHTRDPGAVSALVAEEMSAGAITHSNAHIAVSVTGIAGPGGATLGKPVGLVYIGICKQGEKPMAQEHNFAISHLADTREKVRMATVQTALELLLMQLD